MIAALSLSRDAAADRLPLSVLPEDRQSRIERLDDNTLRIALTGGIRPIGYRKSVDITSGVPRWSRVSSPLDPEDGSISITGPTSGATFYAAEFPDFANRNGFLRVPGGVNLDQPQTLLVVLHGDTPGTTNSGKLVEDYLAPYVDSFGILMYFPTALAATGTSAWNGEQGPHASDYAMLEAGIASCKRLARTINRVVLMAISQGGSTGEGMVQLRPDLFDAVMILSGGFNSRVSEYAQQRNGGNPVRFGRPIPCIGFGSKNDPYSFLPIGKVAEWFSAANGYTGAPETNSIKLDYHDSVKGTDVTVIKLGPYVRRMISEAPDEDTANEDWNDRAMNDIYENFVKKGILPGGE